MIMSAAATTPRPICLASGIFFGRKSRPHVLLYVDGVLHAEIAVSAGWEIGSVFFFSQSSVRGQVQSKSRFNPPQKMIPCPHFEILNAIFVVGETASVRW